MSFPFQSVLKEFVDENSFHYFAKLLMDNDLVNVIDVAMVKRRDIVGLADGSGHPPEVLVPF